MKKKWMLLGCSMMCSIMMANTFFAGDAGFLLPEIPDELMEEETGVLPNPGSYFSDQGKKQEELFTDNEKSWELYYYTEDANADTGLTNWLKACEAEGFTWVPITVQDQSGFEVTDGTHLARLFPHYQNQEIILLMKEADLPIAAAEAEENTEARALEANEVHLVYNGRDYYFSNVFSYLNEYGHYYEITTMFDNADYGLLDIRFPSRGQTGDSWRLSKENRREGFEVSFNDTYFMDLDAFTKRDCFRSDKDYCQVDILYRDQVKVIGRFEGTFNDGADVIQLEFNLSI